LLSSYHVYITHIVRTYLCFDGDVLAIFGEICHGTGAHLKFLLIEGAEAADDHDVARGLILRSFTLNCVLSRNH
jgi:hypothetical protein